MHSRLADRRGLMAVLLLLLSCAELSAQSHQVCARISECNGSSCSWTEARGTCVCIGQTGAGKHLFLSAAHIFRGDVQSCWIGVKGKWLRAKLIATLDNANQDLALLELQPDPLTGLSIKSLPLAETLPPIGSGIDFNGFTDVKYISARGQVKRVKTAGYGLIVSPANAEGQSGGPVIYAGSLIGIMSAHDEGQGETHCTDVEAIRKFIVRSGRAVPPNLNSPPPSPERASESPVNPQPRVPCGPHSSPDPAIAEPPAKSPEKYQRPDEGVSMDSEIPPPSPAATKEPATKHILADPAVMPGDAPEASASKSKSSLWWELLKIGAVIGISAATGGIPAYLLAASKIGKAVTAVQVGARVAGHVKHTIADRRSKRADTANAASETPPTVSPVNAEREVQEIRIPAGPVPPVRHIVQSEFVAVDDGRYREAHEFAISTLGKRYPQQTIIFEAERDLIGQYLNAH